MTYIVIENTPGYLPEDDDPFTTDDYSEAVEYLNNRADDYRNDPEENFEIEYGYASNHNLAAVMVWDHSKTHDLGRYIGVELSEEDEPYCPYCTDGINAPLDECCGQTGCNPAGYTNQDVTL